MVYAVEQRHIYISREIHMLVSMWFAWEKPRHDNEGSFNQPTPGVIFLETSLVVLYLNLIKPEPQRWPIRRKII